MDVHGTTATPVDQPVVAAATTTAADQAAEASLFEDLKAGRITGAEFDKQRKLLVEDEKSGVGAEYRIAVENLQEKYLTGEIDKGTRDRELDALTVKSLESKEKPIYHDVTALQPAAEAIVKKHSLLAGAAGVLPFVYVDFFAVSAIQLRMIQRLCELYGVTFKSELGKGAIVSLAGGGASTLLKGIPFLNMAAIIAGPAIYGGTTYAIGKVFIQHLEAGGTLLSFEPVKMKKYFAQYYNSAPVTLSVPS